jgi:hypothetical protein
MLCSFVFVHAEPRGANQNPRSADLAISLLPYLLLHRRCDKNPVSITPLFATHTNHPQIAENPDTLSPLLATHTDLSPVSPVFATHTKTAGVSLFQTTAFLKFYFNFWLFLFTLCTKSVSQFFCNQALAHSF